MPTTETATREELQNEVAIQAERADQATARADALQARCDQAEAAHRTAQNTIRTFERDLSRIEDAVAKVRRDGLVTQALGDVEPDPPSSERIGRIGESEAPYSVSEPESFEPPAGGSADNNVTRAMGEQARRRGF